MSTIYKATVYLDNTASVHPGSVDEIIEMLCYQCISFSEAMIAVCGRLRTEHNIDSAYIRRIDISVEK